MMIRTLSIRQPWAWAIFQKRGKNIENRLNPLYQRGMLLIHASKTFSRKDYKDAEKFCLKQKLIVPSMEKLTWGGIIGAVDIIECEYSALGDGEWGMPQHYHYKLSDPRLLQTPFPCQGKTGIFYVELPPESEQEIFTEGTTPFQLSLF